MDNRTDVLLDVPKGTKALRVYPAFKSRRPPSFEVRASGAGETRRARAAGYQNGGSVDLMFDRPATQRLTTVCVRNTGSSTLTLAVPVEGQGAERRAPRTGPQRTTRGGEVAPGPQLIRFDAIGRRDVAAVSLLGTALRHASAFKPQGVGGGLIALSLVLVMLIAAAIATLLGRTSGARTGQPPTNAQSHGPGGAEQSPTAGGSRSSLWRSGSRSDLPASEVWFRRLRALVVLLAFVHAASWAIFTPLFQGPDEIVHYGYTERVAETGLPPSRAVPVGTASSPTTETALQSIPWSVTGIPSWSGAESDRLDGILRRLDRNAKNRTYPLSAGYQGGNLPLYNYVTAVPYLGARVVGATVEGRIVWMRVATAGIGALTVLFVMLFLQQLMPRQRTAVLLGGTAVALQPVFAWLSGTVNNDAAVSLGGAVVLYGAARAFRLSLGLREGAIIGIGVSLALLSKSNGYGLLAVAGWCLLWLLFAQRRRILELRRRPLIAAALAVAVAVVPWYVLTRLRMPGNALEGSNTVAFVVGADQLSLPQRVREVASYIWQFYLPQLPFMDEQFPSYPSYPLWQTYLQGFMGRFGAFEFGFAPAQAWRLVGVLVASLVLAIVGVARHRSAIIRRWPLVVAVVGGAMGYAVMINIRGWQFREDSGSNLEQTRYLFPMIGVYALLIGVAYVGLPGRWRRPVAVGAIALMCLQVMASWGLTFERYYL